MDEDKIMSTLKFIKDNVKDNNLFCLATFSTHGYWFKSLRLQKRSVVVFGQVFIFVIENVQETSNDEVCWLINQDF